MKTKTEIDSEINKLETMKPKVRKMTAFGDNNHDAIRAQIDALKDGIDENEAYQLENDGEWTEQERENAVEAILWRDGDGDCPSDGWKGLVKE